MNDHIHDLHSHSLSHFSILHLLTVRPQLCDDTAWQWDLKVSKAIIGCVRKDPVDHFELYTERKKGIFSFGQFKICGKNLLPPVASVLAM